MSQENYEILTTFGIDKLRSLTKLLDVTDYVQRFVDRIKKNQSSFGNLKQDEITKAENISIKHIQQKHFMTKKGCITKELQKSQLNQNIHQDGIIKLHGKITEY